MKITKARLKEIINEELEAAMTPEESDAAYRAAAPLKRAAAEDLGAAIAQSQEARGYDAPRHAALKDELLQLYKQEREEGPSRGLGNVIDALEAEIDEIKRTHDLDA